MNFVLSTNEHPTYRAFLEPICSYYAELGHNVYVAYVSESFPSEIPQCTSFQHIPLLKDFDWGIQAKLARTFYASKLPEDKLYTLLDVDQILINIKWLKGLVLKHSAELLLNPHPVLAVGAQGYLNTSETGKWPLYFTTSTPQGFCKLLDIHKYYGFSKLLKKFSFIDDPIDNKECTANKFENFSDESLFRWCATKHDIPLIHESMPNHTDMKWAHRIDRTDWIMEMFQNPHFGSGFWNQKELTKDQKSMIMEGLLYDSFPARPYSDNKLLIDDIIKTASSFNS